MALKQYKEIDDAADSAIIRCMFDECNARIIRLVPKLASTKVLIGNAPEMANKSTNFYRIDDVWDFDNIGVSKAVPDLEKSEVVGDLAKVERLLICSECDKGPIGFAGYLNAEETDHKKLAYYLSCENVQYDVD